MRTYRRNVYRCAVLAALLVAFAAPAWAGGHHHHRGHHGHRVGLNWMYPPPYWGGYYPGYGPAYGPVPGPFWGPSHLGLGYGYGGHRGSYGLSFSIPLYFERRYAPQPPLPAPSGRPVVQQVSRDCLQVREYQTEIEIGGRTVPAYGDACLQPDGSWKEVTGPFAADY